MTTTWNTRAIVLFCRPYREYDRLYTVYSEQFGKQVLRAHGVVKPKSKLAGSLEPYAEIDLYSIQARHFNKIGGAVIRKRFKELTGDLERLHAAQYVVEVVSRLTAESDPDPKVYHVLYSALTWLNYHSANRLVVYSFVSKLIRVLGYDISVHAKTDEIRKILRWLEHASYEDVEKLRVTDQQWASTVQVIRTWLYEQLSSHIQTEQFLV